MGFSFQLRFKKRKFLGCGSFLPNLTLVASLHDKMFPEYRQELVSALCELANEFHDTVRRLVDGGYCSSG